MATINEIKDKVQKEARVALKSNGGLIAIATGGGKSKIAVDYSKELYEANASVKILLIVPTIVLRDTDWLNEFDKWGARHIFDNNITKKCYVSINKLKNEHYDLVILDELQHITPSNYEFFLNNSVSRTIALSATPPKEKEKRELIKEIGLETVYEIGLDEAVEMGLVAPYDLTLVESNLNYTSLCVEAGGKNKKFMTTENRHYDYLSGDIARSVARRLPEHKMKWKYFNRMRFIYNLESKKRVAQYLLEKVIPKEERTLIFCGSIAMAEALEPHTYHSKSTDADLVRFRNKEINRLSAVQALNEGVNIADVDNALIVQVSSKERHLIQKIGRILRYEEGHIGKIYLMYAKGTVDEKWMNSATESLKKREIHLIKMRT